MSSATVSAAAAAAAAGARLACQSSRSLCWSSSGRLAARGGMCSATQRAGGGRGEDKGTEQWFPSQQQQRQPLWTLSSGALARCRTSPTGGGAVAAFDRFVVSAGRSRRTRQLRGLATMKGSEGDDASIDDDLAAIEREGADAEEEAQAAAAGGGGGGGGQEKGGGGRSAKPRGREKFIGPGGSRAGRRRPDDVGARPFNPNMMPVARVNSTTRHLRELPSLSRAAMKARYDERMRNPMKCKSLEVIKEGVVTRVKMDKTATVRVTRIKEFPKIGLKRPWYSYYKTHDEDNECGVGDKVRIMPCRPVSKTKSWALVDILVRTPLLSDLPMEEKAKAEAEAQAAAEALAREEEETRRIERERVDPVMERAREVTRFHQWPLRA